jgi:hypothetical protein
MKKASTCGISRDEYHAAVRLCPANPAFAGTYEAWVAATMKAVEQLCRQLNKTAAETKI